MSLFLFLRSQCLISVDIWQVQYITKRRMKLGIIPPITKLNYYYLLFIFMHSTYFRCRMHKYNQYFAV